MHWFTYHHLREIYTHVRERFSLRNILHTHAIVLGIAWWKVLVSHIGISFLFAKFAFIQFAFIKTLIGIVVAALFPITQEISFASFEAVPWSEQVAVVGELGEEGSPTEAALAEAAPTEQLPEEKIKAPIIDLYPTLLSLVNSSLSKFQQACSIQESKTQFLETLADTVVEDASIDTLHLLASYCIIDHYDASRYGKLHNSTVTSKADAIKMLTKTMALWTETVFDEEGIYLGKLPYEDVFHDAWYIDYVMYAYDQWVLEWMWNKNIKGQRTLDVLTPVTKNEVKTMLKNLGIENSYPLLDQAGSYVYRDEFAQILIDSFPQKFTDYAYMRGWNVAFYKKFLGQLEGKNAATQWIYLQLLSERLHESSAEELIEQQNLYIGGVDAFLKKVITEITK